MNKQKKAKVSPREPLAFSFSDQHQYVFK